VWNDEDVKQTIELQENDKEIQNDQEEDETDEDDKTTIFSEARSTMSYISAKPTKVVTLLD
jgi:hypothetical protein